MLVTPPAVSTGVAQLARVVKVTCTLSTLSSPAAQLVTMVSVYSVLAVRPVTLKLMAPAAVVPSSVLPFMMV